MANRLTMAFKVRQLHIQNHPYSKKVKAPTNSELLQMTADERRIAQKAKIVNIKDRHEKGNTFKGYAAEVTNAEQIRALYKHLKIKHADATHVVMAHALSGTYPGLLDFDDNGENGAGRRIVDWFEMQNVVNTVVFIVRYHSGQNLGSRRFDLILELVAELIERIKQPNCYSISHIPHKLSKVQLGSKRYRGRSATHRGGTTTIRGRGHPQHMAVNRAPYPVDTSNTYSSLATTNQYDSNMDASESDPEVVLRYRENPSGHTSVD